MDKCREAFERFECEKYEANYDDMRKNWDWYESQFGYRYSPESLRGKDWAVWQKAWQHQQAKVEGLQEEFAEDERFLKEQIKDKDLKISNLEYQQGMDKDLIQTLQGRSAALQDRVNELQKQVIDQGQRFNEQAQRVKDLEHKNGELQKRVDAATRKWVAVTSIATTCPNQLPDEFFKKLDELHDALCGVGLEQALKGEG